MVSITAFLVELGARTLVRAFELLTGVLRRATRRSRRWHRKAARRRGR